jgi:hypothetical protein
MDTKTGSPNNATINFIEDLLYSHRPGKISISNRNAEESSSIVISDAGVVITNNIAVGGISINDRGTSIQGSIAYTSKGETIKIFTYQETLLLESVPKEVIAEVAGKTTGLNASVGMDGVIPLFTDVAPGPMPHFHLITAKHVHRVEPQYLYRIPSILNIISGAAKQLQGFFSA